MENILFFSWLRNIFRGKVTLPARANPVTAGDNIDPTVNVNQNLDEDVTTKNNLPPQGFVHNGGDGGQRISADRRDFTPDPSDDLYYQPRRANPRLESFEMDDIELPVKGGRNSVGLGQQLGLSYASLATIPTDFDPQWYDAIDYLVTYNGDFAKAVENTVELASTEMTFKFADSVSETLKKKALEIIHSRIEHFNAEGSANVTNMALRQLAGKGAISVEIVPFESLDGVKEIVPVPHRQIRFKWDMQNERFQPVQVLAGFAPTADAFNEIVLNTVTYKYYAEKRKDGSPYAIPPFLAAMESTMLNRDIWGSFSAAFKRLGLFGFLNVLVRAPQPKPNESDEAYLGRMRQYLDLAVEEVGKGIDRGFVAGFKDHHEFKMEGDLTNLRDGAEYLKASTEDKITGLGQTPFLMGKSYSTTETLARVLLLMLGKKVETYQMLVAKLWGDILSLELRMQGVMVGPVAVEFAFPMLGDEQREQEARKLKIENAKALYDMGIIEQNDIAQELGYTKPALPAPRVQAKDIAVPALPDPAKKTKDKVEPNKKTQPNSYGKVTLPEFDYGTDCGCGHEGLDSFGESLDTLIQQYLSGMFGKYEKSTRRMSIRVSKALAKMVNPTLDEVKDAILSQIYIEFEGMFSAGRKRLIEKYISQMFREAKSQALMAYPSSIKSPVFNLLDFRAMDFFARHDNFYLGKFIQDESTRNSLSKWIEEKFIADDLPFRDRRAVAEAFKKDFAGRMNLEQWKIFRIIATTVNRLRNAASLSYMNDALITQYTIFGVSDRLQCKYCAALQGKVFTVSKAMSKLNELVNSDPAMTPAITPFINSIFKKPEDMQGLTSEELEAAGISIPPFHGHCRDRIAAVQ